MGAALFSASDFSKQRILVDSDIYLKKIYNMNAIPFLLLKSFSFYTKEKRRGEVTQIQGFEPDTQTVFKPIQKPIPVLMKA